MAFIDFEQFLPDVAERLWKGVAKVIREKREINFKTKETERSLRTALVSHLTRVANWSMEFQFSRMNIPRNTERETVGLNFTSTARRFRATAHEGEFIGEDDLLTSNRHWLITGPPGAGKTTTVKRLCHRILHKEPSSPKEWCQAPILLRLRTFSEATDDYSAIDSKPLIRRIAEELGIETFSIDKEFNTARKGREPNIIKKRVYMCDGGELDVVVPSVLNGLRCTVFLDGADEVNPEIKQALIADAAFLVESSRTYTLIITTRTGDEIVGLENVSRVEVCPLTEDNVIEIARRWLGARAEAFWNDARRVGLEELATRPLFLGHLLNLYHSDGSLPKQPYEIYELIMLLMIRDWDGERGLDRSSRYSWFRPEKKLRFLAAIAFELLYVERLRVFSATDLVQIYIRICDEFELPKSECNIVAKEIETHTGIILECGLNRYEFSHLTLQEYLAALHMVRAPLSPKSICTYIRHAPGALALAVVLSSDPPAWLASVLLNSLMQKSGSPAEISSFLERLDREAPVFSRSEALGVCVLSAVIRLCDLGNGYERNTLEGLVSGICKSDSARLSFCRLLTGLFVASLDSNMTHYSVRRIANAEAEAALPLGIELPSIAKIERNWVDRTFLGRELFLRGRVLTMRSDVD